MKMRTQTAVQIPTGMSVESRPVTVDPFSEEVIRDIPGAVELSRAEPVRGSSGTAIVCHPLTKTLCVLGKNYLRERIAALFLLEQDMVTQTETPLKSAWRVKRLRLRTRQMVRCQPQLWTFGPRSRPLQGAQAPASDGLSGHSRAASVPGGRGFRIVVDSLGTSFLV